MLVQVLAQAQVLALALFLWNQKDPSVVTTDTAVKKR